jgi:hypothetical protein
MAHERLATKRRRQEGRQQRRTRQQRRKAKRDAEERARKRWNWSNLAVGLASLVASVGFVIWPEVSLTYRDNMDPNALFSAPFIVENTGWLSVHDVEPVCGVESVKIGNLELGNLGIAPAHEAADVLKPRGAISFDCQITPRSSRVPGSEQSGKIDVRVTYRPWTFWPWTWELSQRFKAEYSEARGLAWRPIAR